MDVLDLTQTDTDLLTAEPLLSSPDVERHVMDWDTPRTGDRRHQTPDDSSYFNDPSLPSPILPRKLQLCDAHLEDEIALKKEEAARLDLDIKAAEQSEELDVHHLCQLLLHQNRAMKELNDKLDVRHEMVVYKNLDVATAEMDRQAEMFSVLEEKIEESTHQIQEAHRAFNELPSNWKGSAKDSNSLVERLAQLQTAVEREMEEKERELQRVRDETNVSTSRLHETMEKLSSVEAEKEELQKENIELRKMAENLLSEVSKREEENDALHLKFSKKSGAVQLAEDSSRASAVSINSNFEECSTPNVRCFPHEKDSTQNYSKKKTEELSLRQFLSELSESVRQVEEIGRGTTRLLEETKKLSSTPSAPNDRLRNIVDNVTIVAEQVQALLTPQRNDEERYFLSSTSSLCGHGYSEWWKSSINFVEGLVAELHAKNSRVEELITENDRLLFDLKDARDEKNDLDERLETLRTEVLVLQNEAFGKRRDSDSQQVSNKQTPAQVIPRHSHNGVEVGGLPSVLEKIIQIHGADHVKEGMWALCRNRPRSVAHEETVDFIVAPSDRKFRDLVAELRMVEDMLLANGQRHPTLLQYPAAHAFVDSERIDHHENETPLGECVNADNNSSKNALNAPSREQYRELTESEGSSSLIVDLYRDREKLREGNRMLELEIESLREKIQGMEGQQEEEPEVRNMAQYREIVTRLTKELARERAGKSTQLLSQKQSVIDTLVSQKAALLAENRALKARGRSEHPASPVNQLRPHCIADERDLVSRLEAKDEELKVLTERLNEMLLQNKRMSNLLSDASPGGLARTSSECPGERNRATNDCGGDSKEALRNAAVENESLRLALREAHERIAQLQREKTNLIHEKHELEQHLRTLQYPISPSQQQPTCIANPTQLHDAEGPRSTDVVQEQPLQRMGANASPPHTEVCGAIMDA